MLVLTRKIGDTVHIDGNIEIVIVEVRNSQVRLGITAPPEITIRRGELPPRKQTENGGEK